MNTPKIIECIASEPAEFAARVRDLVLAPRPYALGVRYRSNISPIRIDLLLDPAEADVPIYWFDGSGHRGTASWAEIPAKVAEILCLAGATPAPSPAPARNPSPSIPKPPANKRRPRVGETLDLF